MTRYLRPAVEVAAASAACSWLGATSLTGVSSLLRRNFHGREVSLRGGVGAGLGALAAGLAAGRALRRQQKPGGPAAAAATAVLCATAAGLVDDLDAGSHDGQAPAKGLHGHLGALARGQVTTGVLKIVVIGGGALVAGSALAWQAASHGRPGRNRLPLLVDAAGRATLIASWANLANLLDLRPGRALKACGLVALGVAAAGGAGAAPSRLLSTGVLAVAAVSLPGDLAERTMLGDTGANALGALLGASLAAHSCPALRATACATGVGLVLASEKVSFSQVIATNRWLSALDQLGRLPA